MGLLISTYYSSKSQENETLSYAKFREYFLSSQKSIDAKNTFGDLRHLQKKFEDAFNNPIVYNKVGAIIRIINDKDAFIRGYFNNNPIISFDDLDRYYKWAFIELTHKEIIENNQNKFDEKFNDILKVLENNNLYNENPETAFRLLLRLNIDEDNKQEDGKGRRFDFSIWDNGSRGRSLEHIYPKSKVWHNEKNGDSVIIMDGNGEICDDSVKQDDSSYISRESCEYKQTKTVASEHSIGNLVLLYKDDNSAFNNSSFEEKKSLFFNLFFKKNVDKKKDIFKSRHLLHTIYKFAYSEWKGEQIAKNKYETLEEFTKYYKEYYEK